MRRTAATFLVLLIGLLVTASASPAVAGQVRGFLGMDCKQAPTPDMPGQGLAGFFEKTPSPLPKQADPFAKGSKTTIYQQYGLAGLRWHTYDLGCGPDAMRNPEAVIGTAMSNWMMNGPLMLTALTSSVTGVAFHPTFLNVFDPMIAKVSGSLHRSLFATWVPAVIALLGVAILLRARRSALATTAAAIGWALMVILVATALFRWPIAAGHFADASVTKTLGSVVTGLDGGHQDVSPGVAVASSVEDSILYKSWLAGELGTSTSATAKKYGPALFESQALTWHQAYVVEHDPARGKAIIATKQSQWTQVAAAIKASDPTAYDNLTGDRSDTRVGYAVLSSLATYLSLPFLLMSALLLLGSFLIVRLAVMLFPAFATLGVFPAGRGLVIGTGRTVGAALVNAVIFGVGAAVTIRVIGLILDPASHLPGWLSLVLMPLFGFIMWIALKPFRRLTTMVGARDTFGDAAGAFGGSARHAKRWAKRATSVAAGVYTGNVAAAATVDAIEKDEPAPVPDRAEARPTYDAPNSPPALPAGPTPVRPSAGHGSPESQASSQTPPSSEGLPTRASEGVPLPPTEPEWVDGEQVYTVYRPSDKDATDAA